MYHMPPNQLHGSPFISRAPTVSKRKFQETFTKRNLYSEAKKIRKQRPYEKWLKLRHKMYEADLRKKTETNAFADFLSRVMPAVQARKFSTPLPPPPTPQKMRHGTQTAATSASVTASPPPPPIKEFKYEPPKQERVE